MTLGEALRRSPEETAFAGADVVGGWVYTSKESIHNGVEAWTDDPASLNWHPTGGESRWNL